MSAELIRLAIDGDVATIKLHNPPLNIFCVPMTQQLHDALDAIEADDAVRAVIVTGGADVFCAGSDITEFKDFMEPGEVVERKLLRQNAAFRRLEMLGKPTIAAINGLAFGGGVEIAMCCDLVVATSASRFALPEMKLGVFPSSGGPFRTARRIGVGRTKQLIFLAEPIDAATALDWGLIDRVAEPGLAIVLAHELALQMAQRPPLAFALCKPLIEAATEQSIDQLIERSLAASDRAFSSPECKEGVRAFFAKEKPVFGVKRQSAAQAGGAQ